MKTKFAKEKSEYTHLIFESMKCHTTVEDYLKIIKRIKELEKIVKDQGDELIFIVTTEKTNPMRDKTAPPMSMENIKKS